MTNIVFLVLIFHLKLKSHSLSTSKKIMKYKNVSYDTPLCPLIAIPPDASSYNINAELLRDIPMSLSPAHQTPKSISSKCLLGLLKLYFIIVVHTCCCMIVKLYKKSKCPCLMQPCESCGCIVSDLGVTFG